MVGTRLWRLPLELQILALEGLREEVLPCIISFVPCFPFLLVPSRPQGFRTSTDSP